MSCNTFIPIMDLVREVEALLAANYIDKDDPRITGGVFTNPTIKEGFLLDVQAREEFCRLVQECGLDAPFGKMWLSRPLYPDQMFVSYEDSGEPQTKWKTIQAVLESAGVFGPAATSLSSRLAAEIDRATTAENEIISRAEAADVNIAANEESIATNATAISTESSRAVAAEGVLTSAVDALELKDLSLQSQVNSIGGGKKAYTTYALMVADEANIDANSSIDVTNDTDPLKNGTYSYDGAVFTKSIYDIESIVRTKVLNTFKTKSLMDASALPNGADALVTNDTVNHGLYVKTAGAWVRSSYDPQYILEDYIYKTLLSDGITDANIEIIEGAAVNSSGSGAVIAAGVGRKYIKIDVRNQSSMSVSGSIEYSAWTWVFVDAGMRLVELTKKHGDVEIDIPKNAVYAVRTFKFGENEGNPELKVTLQRANDSVYKLTDTQKLQTSILNELSDEVSYVKEGESEYYAEIDPIYGAAVATDTVTRLLSSGEGRAYLKLDVSNVRKIAVTGAVTSNTWYWIFTDAKGENKVISPYKNNTSFNVPESAYYAYRTYMADDIPDLPSLSIKMTMRIPSLNALSKEVEALKNKEVKIITSREAKMEDDFAKGNTLKISDFVGASQHEQIDNAIAFIKQRGHGILDMESGTWMRESAILLPDNCWLYLNNATIQLEDGVFDNVIRNDGIVPDPDPFKIALEINPNVNIRVFGNDIASSAVNGSAVTYTAPHPVTGGEPIPFIGDYFGWRTISVYLVNVKPYKLHDFTLGNCKCWAVSQEHGNEDFEVYNIDIQSRGIKNGDGIDVRIGCKNGRIYNITGNTGDDMVALSALAKSAPRVYPEEVAIYPMQVGGYTDRGYGVDITDIDIYNIAGSGGHNGVRLLCSGGSQMHRISVDDVSDTGSGFTYSLVLVSSGYGTPAAMGDMTNITVNGVASTNSGQALKISGNIKDSVFNNITQANAAKKLVDDTATKDNVTITNARRV